MRHWSFEAESLRREKGAESRREMNVGSSLREVLAHEQAEKESEFK